MPRGIPIRKANKEVKENLDMGRKNKWGKSFVLAAVYPPWVISTPRPQASEGGVKRLFLVAIHKKKFHLWNIIISV